MAASGIEIGYSAPELNAAGRNYTHQLEHLYKLQVPRRAIQAILDNCRHVTDQWYRAYAQCAGDAHALSRDNFLQTLGRGLLRSRQALAAADLPAYLAERQHIIQNLMRQGVAPSEILLLAILLAQVEGELMDRLEVPSEVRASLSRFHLAQIVSLQKDMRCTAPGHARTEPAWGLVGASAAMTALEEQIEAAGSNCDVALIVGESGTGKELVARALHACAQARSGPFIPLNCAALSQEIFESELFGHRRGSFSGATHDHPGLFRAAEGGTLFLDEITEMHASAQAKLLRAIEERKIRPVGSTHAVPVDVRILASTNRDPEEAIAGGYLRRDLYFRFRVILRTPPLREHAEDIPALADHFIGLNRRIKRAIPVEGISQSAFDAMHSYHWPGNVRELANAIETAFIFGKSAMIGTRDLPPAIGGYAASAAAANRDGAGIASLAEAECRHIQRALQATGGNVFRASKVLGISRKKLYSRITDFGLLPLVKSARAADPPR